MSYPQEKYDVEKDAEKIAALVEVDVPEEDRLYGWRARLRKAEAAIGIEAQGIKRVNEGAARAVLVFPRGEANYRARGQLSGIPRLQHGKLPRSGCRASRLYTDLYYRHC